MAAHLAIGAFAGGVVVAGALTGIVSFGFSTPPVATEGGAFVVSVVSGYAGDRVFSALAKRFGF